MKGDIKLFESKKIRTQWDEERESWFFSVIDVIEALTGTDRPRKYWSDLKTKLAKEGSQLSDNIGQLKMIADDGKLRLTEKYRRREIKKEKIKVMPLSHAHAHNFVE